MATTQSLRALNNSLIMRGGSIPDGFPQIHMQSPLEKYGVSMRYATGLVQYYKDNYDYRDVQFGQNMLFKADGHFEDNSIGK